MKNRSVLVLALGLSLGLSLSLPAAAGNFIAMPEVGTGKIDFGDFYSFSEGAGDDNSTYSVGFVGGYKFDSNLILGASVSYTGTEYVWFWDALDEYSLTEKGLLIGYSFNVHRNFRIVPMVGWNSWELDVEEGALFNPGPEDELEFNGSDSYARLNLEFPITELFQINASYIYGDYDFGRYTAARVGFKFEF